MTLAISSYEVPSASKWDWLPCSFRLSPHSLWQASASRFPLVSLRFILRHFVAVTAHPGHEAVSSEYAHKEITSTQPVSQKRRCCQVRLHMLHRSLCNSGMCRHPKRKSAESQDAGCNPLILRTRRVSCIFGPPRKPNLCLLMQPRIRSKPWPTHSVLVASFWQASTSSDSSFALTQSA